MTLPSGMHRDVIDKEIRECQQALRSAIMRFITRDTMDPLHASPERMTALLYTLINELMMCAAAANLTSGKSAGSDLVDLFLTAVPEGIRVRTLQLRHAVDEMQDG
jgi:hypothetical protein